MKNLVRKDVEYNFSIKYYPKKFAFAVRCDIKYKEQHMVLGTIWLNEVDLVKRTVDGFKETIDNMLSIIDRDIEASENK